VELEVSPCTPFVVPVLVTSTTPPAAETAADWATPLRRNEAESRLSIRSAFRFVTLVAELTVKGALPAATLRPSAVAPAPVLVFVTGMEQFYARRIQATRTSQPPRLLEAEATR
jgi:hypothetical protein